MLQNPYRDNPYSPNPLTSLHVEIKLRPYFLAEVTLADQPSFTFNLMVASLFILKMLAIPCDAEGQPIIAECQYDLEVCST